MANVGISRDSKIETIARTRLENLEGFHLLVMSGMDHIDLLEVAEEASRQEPPNEAVMVTAGSIALSRLSEPGRPFQPVYEQLLEVVEFVFPKFDRSILEVLARIR